MYSVVESVMAGVPHLRISREEGDDPIPWDHLQAIKAEHWGDDAVAVEMYPPAADLVDEIRARHLFLWTGREWPNLMRHALMQRAGD
jgi:hypothetical protein